MTITPTVNEFQRRALLALIDAEAARVAATAREGRAMKHRLFALIRERFGCKYTLLPRKRYKEAVLMLLDDPLDEPLAKTGQSPY